MDDEIIFLKEKFYDNLLDTLPSNKKITNKSLFLTFLKMTSNEVMNCLDNADVDSAKIPISTLQSLIGKDLIRGGKDFSHYILTSKGIWEIEKSLEVIDIESLISFIDGYKYAPKSGEKLDKKEKTILLGLISIRAFSEKTPLNRTHLDALDKIVEVLADSKDFLVDMGVFSEYAFTKPSQEHAVEAIFRRTNNLKQRTRGIYCFGGKKHWLNVFDEDSGEVSKEKLGYLFWKIFNGNLSGEEQAKVSDFCDNIINKYKNYVFDSEERESFVFSNVSYKNIIKDSLFEMIEYHSKWEKMDKNE